MATLSEPSTRFSAENLIRLNSLYENADPGTILQWGYNTFGRAMVLGTGFGSSGIFLIHEIQKLQYDTPVFFLDTHLHFEQTYRLKKTLEDRFGISIVAVDPDLSLDEQAGLHGEQLWKKDPDRCCYLRKVRPLQRYLSDKKAWISGIRRSQGEARSRADIFEWDEKNKVMKINPLVHWSAEMVWDEIYNHNLPYNPLHDDGYPSIGCIPCTDKVADSNSGERAGRWKESDKTECGIHLPGQQPYENGDS